MEVFEQKTPVSKALFLDLCASTKATKGPSRQEVIEQAMLDGGFLKLAPKREFSVKIIPLESKARILPDLMHAPEIRVLMEGLHKAPHEFWEEGEKEISLYSFSYMQKAKLFTFLESLFCDRLFLKFLSLWKKIN